METNQKFAALFIGYLATRPIEFALEKSSTWSQYKIMPKQDPSHLTIVYREKRKYIGRTFLYPQIPLKEVQNQLQQIQERLKTCLPQNLHNSLSSAVFAVTLIT